MSQTPKTGIAVPTGTPADDRRDHDFREETDRTRAPRRNEVARLRMTGVHEHYDWRQNDWGPGSVTVLEHLGRGDTLGVVDLCGHPPFLVQLYLHQVRIFLGQRCELDAEYHEDHYEMYCGRGRSLDYNRLAYASERTEDLYNAYLDWCLGTKQESVPRRAFTFALRQALPQPRRLRYLKDHLGVQEQHVMGVTLLSSV